MKQIIKTTEFFTYKAQSTDEEITKGMLGGSLEPFVTLSTRYQQAKEFWQDAGWTIVSEDLDSLSFKAEKVTYAQVD